MAKTGILGGTFDPIHLGHLITAENALDGAGLDRVLLIPTGCSYFKEDQKVTPPQLRYEMTCLAAADHPRLFVTDMETKRPGNSYTAETLAQLHTEYPEDELYYIVGADTLVMMNLWKDPGYIFSSCHILVETRQDEVAAKGLLEEAEQLRRKFDAQITILPARNVEISSTEIRQRVKDGRSIRYLVPRAVEEFIQQHRLYLNS
jgi:nicotinate-nucleotide adenylyltransferase